MMAPIPDILQTRGPLIGSELAAAGPFPDILELWRACHAPGIQLRRTGRRYLRLDSAVPGYARLSPSIRREFLTYTLIGLPNQTAQIETRAAELEQQAIHISQAKIALARESICMATASLPDETRILRQTVFLIAGDVIYNMAHRVPRPEKSSGRLVNGSDLDIIIVTTDEFPEEDAIALDEAIYRQKHYLLTHPDFQEEIDYILKPLSRVRQQLAFDTFEHMVACKILDESQLLFGSPFLYETLMEWLDRSGVRNRLKALEQAAIVEREEAETLLLNPAALLSANRPALDLFYTREEGDEIY